jgi:hypothetical protein
MGRLSFTVTLDPAAVQRDRILTLLQRFRALGGEWVTGEKSRLHCQGTYPQGRLAAPDQESTCLS